MLAALAAALLLGAVGSASASAEACTKKAGSKHVALCLEGQKNQASLTAKIVQASPTATLKLPTAWPPMEWVCSADKVGVETAKLTSVPVEGGSTVKLAFRPTWSGCTTKEGAATKCVMPAEREFFEQPGKFTNSAGKLVMSSTNFLEFELKNKSESEICQTIRGWHHVGGAYECKLQEPEVETAQHELSCESQGSETRIEEKPTWFKYAVKVSLGFPNEAKKFSIYEY